MAFGLDHVCKYCSRSWPCSSFTFLFDGCLYQFLRSSYGFCDWDLGLWNGLLIVTLLNLPSFQCRDWLDFSYTFELDARYFLIYVYVLYIWRNSCPVCSFDYICIAFDFIYNMQFNQVIRPSTFFFFVIGYSKAISPVIVDAVAVNK